MSKQEINDDKIAIWFEILRFPYDISNVCYRYQFEALNLSICHME